MRSLLACALGGLAACVGPGLAPGVLPGLAVEGRAGGVAVVDSGEVVAVYRHADGRVPALYPVHAPGGVPVTRAFPFEDRPGEERDRPHHVSLWFAHGDVNGHDFWHGPDTRIDNGEAILSEAGGGAARIRARNLWVAKDRLILIEDRTMTFVSEGERRLIDVELVLTPTREATTFGDTPEGTFALRLHPQLRRSGPVAAGSARNSEGASGAAVDGRRARWVAFSGPVGGRPVTVALMDHPDNPRHPTWWSAPEHGLAAANPFGIHAFQDAPPAAGAMRVAASEVLVLRYRVALFAGAADDDAIEDVWEAFAE